MKRPAPNPATTIIPSEESIVKIATLLISQTSKRAKAKNYAAVKDVLSLLATGAAISAAILVPNSGRILSPIIRDHKDWDEW